MNVQLDIFAAQIERNKGIARAVDNTDKNIPGWSKMAYEMFTAWLSNWPSGYKFLIENFRQVAQIRGLPDPIHNRAFGGLALKAQKENLIKSVGTKKVSNVKARRCFATEWQKV